MKIVDWFKKLIRVVNSYDHDTKHLERRISEATALIRERTNISADFHAKGIHQDTIIVIGRYKNADYIQTFSIRNDDFQYTVKQLREMQKFGVVNRVDAVPELRACVLREMG